MKLRTRLLAFLLSVIPFAGCSLILDPENCGSDDDCLPGGACKSGICIGGVEAAGGADAAGGSVAGGAQPDASGGGQQTPDTGAGGARDQGLDPDIGGADTGAPDAGDAFLPPDVPPVTAPPTCSIVSPSIDDGELVLAAPSLPVTIQVTDPDTTPENLVATLNLAAAPLDAQGTATVEHPLVEGPNTLLLEARDPEGHTCTARRQVTRDTTGPTLEITIADGAVIGNDLQADETPLVLLIRADDTNGMADVSVTARGLPVNDVVGPDDGVYTATIILADGNNAIVVTGTDARGNTTAHPLAVFFDGQDPELNVVFPIEGQLVEVNTIEVRGTVADNLDLAAVRLTTVVTAPGHAPANVPVQRPAADGTFRFAGVPLYNGDNTITVTARDAVRQAVVAIHLRVEAGAPVVDITDPDPSRQYVTGTAEIHVFGTSSRSVEELDIGPPGNPQTVIPEDGEWDAVVRLPAQGTFTISAIGRTPGGRPSAAATLTVLYDDSPPVIRITRPADGFCTAAATIQVEGDAVDVETRVPVVTINGTPAAVQAATNRYRADVPVNEGLDQVLTVEGENTALLSAEATLNFSVDRTGPTVALARADGAWVAADDDGNIEIRGTVADDGCGLAALPLLVNGTDTLATPEGEFVARQNRGPTPHVVVVATDIVGNQSRAEADYRVDATAPIIEDLDPPGSVALRGNNIGISARVTDAESGLATVTIGGVTVQAVNGRFSRNVALVPGENAVEFIATDNVGLARTVVLHINRDTTPPVVAITSPANNTDVEDKLIIEGTLTDGDDGSGIDHVTVGNVDVVPDADGRWRHVGLPLINGPQTITVVGFDQAGNQSGAVNLAVTVRDFGVSPTEGNGLAGATQTSWTGAADLNADGRLDLVALTDAPDGDARIFIQGADGTFEAHPLTDFGLPAGLMAHDAAFADLNGDARFDLIVASPGGASTVYFGDRQAGFVAIESPAYPIAGDVTGLAVGDLDRDGLLDILFVAGDDSTVRFGLIGGGATVSTLVALGAPSLTGMSRAQFVDLNTDGVQELLAVGPGGSRAWSGELDGTFTSFADLDVTFGDAPATQLFALDTDRDRDLDVVTLGATHAVHQNTLAGAAITGFNTAVSGLVAVAGDLSGAGGDFDGDARDDVAIFGQSGVSIFGGGVAGFTARGAVAQGIRGVPASRTGLAVDLDGDGDLDLLAAGDSGLTLIRNNVTTTRAAAYLYARVLATRALDGNAPVDATGVIVYCDPLAVNPAANRALVHPVTSPLVVTFGTALRADLTIQWIEKDGGGDNNLTVASQRPQAANAQPIARQPLE